MFIYSAISVGMLARGSRCKCWRVSSLSISMTLTVWRKHVCNGTVGWNTVWITIKMRVMSIHPSRTIRGFSMLSGRSEDYCESCFLQRTQKVHCFWKPNIKWYVIVFGASAFIFWIKTEPTKWFHALKLHAKKTVLSCVNCLAIGGNCDSPKLHCTWLIS